MAAAASKDDDASRLEDGKVSRINMYFFLTCAIIITYYFISCC